MPTMNEQQFEALYGPLALYSEYQRGEHIRYRIGSREATGTILWICAPGIVGSQQMPTQYIVEPDDREGFPDTVWQSDILQ